MKTSLAELDTKFIALCKQASMPLARLAIFIIYFWFGILKVIGASPANPLVATLQEKTLPFLSFHSFIIAFGLFEVIIGILFLFKKLDRLSIFLFAVHMVTTGMVLVLLPATAWNDMFIPTLEGQYVIKNIALIALAVTIASRIEPMRKG